MTAPTLWIDAVCPTFPAHLRERFTLPLLGHPAAPSLASPDACVAQALIARLQGFGRRDAAGPATAVAYPADPHKSGTGLGSRWHALLQALEWAALQRDSRVVLSEVGEKGVPYLARRGCAVSSERCFFQDLDTCDSFAACSATRVVGTVGWAFPQNVTRQRKGAWWKVWQTATVWEAPVPAVFKGRRSLLWWQSQLALFALQASALDAGHARRRVGAGARPDGQQAGEEAALPELGRAPPVCQHARAVGRQVLEGGDLPQRAGLREGGRIAAEAVWRLSPRAVVRGPRGDQPDPRGAGGRLRTGVYGQTVRPSPQGKPARL